MEGHANALQQLLLPHRYQMSRETVFPSPTSLSWFMRQNRERLTKAGALLQVGGRNLIDEARFDEVVVEVGRERAAA